SSEYPGYRRIWINGGAVESYNYKSPKYSYPFYKDTNVGGTTNLGGLSTPAIKSEWSTTPGSTTEDVTCTVTNYLVEKALPDAYIEFPMKYLSGGYYYKVTNGRLGEVYDVNSSTRMNQAYADEIAKNGGSKAVRVYKSASTDKTVPTGSVTVNGGATSTTNKTVTLDITASDSGGSGLMGMMVSERSDFTGAYWEPYGSTRPWTLSDGAGKKTIYVKFGDRAMPTNTRSVSTSIVYDPPPGSGPRIVSVNPGAAEPGTTLDVLIEGAETSFKQSLSRASFSGEGINVNRNTFIDSTHLTANITVDVTAPVGPRSVTVTGSGSIQALADGFIVLGPMTT
ncbi:MAG: hypothetical protein L6427_11635, partial [Actinomycetia bacterium]|nr:hypothetical protein [Actinomycetes bacterium]